MNQINKDNEGGVILLFLSDYKPDRSSFMYKLIDSLSERAYPGSQTNDATVRYLISKANADRHDIKQIICILTDECRFHRYKTDYGEEMTSWERFNEMVQEYCSENNFIIPQITPVNYDSDEVTATSFKSEPQKTDKQLRIYQKVTEIINQSKLRYFYVDFTGGFRDINYLFTMIIQNLQFNGAECSSIVYGNYINIRGKEPITNIKEISNTYNMSKILEACDTFINTGYSQQLIDVFKRLVIKTEQQDYKAISSLVYAIKDFTDTVSLCDINKLDSVIENLSQAVITAEKVETSSDLYLEMFRSLIPTIKASMIPNPDSQMTTKDTIKWCIDRRMIQQALTIFTEKMADYYFDHHVCDDIKKLALPKKIDSQYASGKTQAFYLDFFNDVSYPDPSSDLGKHICSIWNGLDNNQDKLQIFLNKMETERSRLKDGISKDALGKLITYIKEHFASIDKNEKEHFPASGWNEKNNLVILEPISKNDFYSYFKTRNGKISFTDFINGIKSEPSAIMHYFMYENEAAFIRLKDKIFECKNYLLEKGESEFVIENGKQNNVKNFKIKQGILQKLQACLNLECGKLPDDISKNLSKFSPEVQIQKRAYVANVMRCYTLIKFIRNHTNHAAGSAENILEKVFLDYFSKGTFLGKETPCSKLEPIIHETENNENRLNAENILNIISYALNLA